MVCSVRVPRLGLMEVMISARMMGAMKPSVRLHRAMAPELRSASQNCSSSKSSMNFSKPTHSLPNSPLVTLYSSKAMKMPLMGM